MSKNHPLPSINSSQYMLKTISILKKKSLDPLSIPKILIKSIKITKNYSVNITWL